MATSSSKRGKKTPRRVRADFATWSWFAHGPLLGLGLIREGLRVYAWDDARQLYLVDMLGKTVTETRLPADIVHVSAADTGDGLAVLMKDGQLWWLDESLAPAWKSSFTTSVLSVAVDPHGEYAAVHSRLGSLVGLDRMGTRIWENERIGQPLRFLAFVPQVDRLLGVAEQGLVATYDGRGRLVWEEIMYSTVGGIAVDHSGDVLLLAAYSHGLLRYDSEGRRVGSYQLDRPPRLVAIDMSASRIATATIDGYVITLGIEGNIVAERSLGEKIVGLALDALGRFLVVGLATGEARLIPWDELAEVVPREESAAGDLAAAIKAPLPQPVRDDGSAWKSICAGTMDEAASAVLEPVGYERQIALYSHRKNVRIFDQAGQIIHESPRMEGGGRALRQVEEGGLLAATDRRVLAYDPRSTSSILGTFDLFEISHFFGMPKFGEAIVIEACDQISRIRFPSETIWKHKLPIRVASVATDSSGRTAMVLEDHQLIVVSPEGKALGKYRSSKPRAMIVVAGNKGEWITATLGEEMLRGHALTGEERWAESLPWEPWGLHRVGTYLVVTSSSGQSTLWNLHGELLAENGESREGARYLELADGMVGRLYRTGRTVTVSRFDGKLLWRKTLDGEVAAIAADGEGVWVIVDTSLQFFPF